MQIHGFNTQLDNTNRAATLPQLELQESENDKETITATNATPPSQSNPPITQDDWSKLPLGQKVKHRINKNLWGFFQGLIPDESAPSNFFIHLRDEGNNFMGYLHYSDLEPI